MSTEERRLAAIVFTDICGFTELMSRDETKAMALLEQQRALLKPIISNFNGEWLKEIGDGVLIAFPSPVKAVTCSLEIQRILAHNSELTIRIGIHIGDVIQKDGDVFGDAVNIASRLEPLAEPGGICVSERVHEDIENKPDISTSFQEEQLLKGVEKPIKVYSIFTQMGTAPERADATVHQPTARTRVEHRVHKFSHLRSHAGTIDQRQPPCQSALTTLVLIRGSGVLAAPRPKADTRSRR